MHKCVIHLNVVRLSHTFPKTCAIHKTQTMVALFWQTCTSGVSVKAGVPYREIGIVRKQAMFSFFDLGVISWKGRALLIVRRIVASECPCTLTAPHVRCCWILPKHNCHVARLSVQSYKQQECESVDDVLTRLKLQAKNV